MVKMVMQTEARSFEISKLKNLLENPLNPPEVTRIGDPSKSCARSHHILKIGSKLKYFNSDQLLPS